MKKIKLKALTILSLGLAVAAGVANPVDAVTGTSNLKVNTSVSASTSLKTNSGTSSPSVNANVNGQVNGSASSSIGNTNSSSSIKSTTSHQTQVKATSSKAHVASANAEAHRSAVARFVQNLVSIADRDNGIGSQVRIIANAQNASSEASVEAMTEVENRGALRTFLFGTGYSNLNFLRTESAKTADRINELRFLAAQATDAQVRADMNAQIDALVSTQTTMDQFITKNDGKFSLFGWFVRLFS